MNNNDSRDRSSSMRPRSFSRAEDFVAKNGNEKEEMARR